MNAGESKACGTNLPGRGQGEGRCGPEACVGPLDHLLHTVDQEISLIKLLALNAVFEAACDGGRGARYEAEILAVPGRVGRRSRRTTG